MNTPSSRIGLAKAALFDMESAERFERLTRMARRLFDVPIVALDLERPAAAGADAWLLESGGCAEPTEASRSAQALLGWAKAQARPTVIADIERATCAGLTPDTGAAIGIRAIAALPLLDDAGRRMGSVLLADTRPHALAEEDMALLADLACGLAMEINAQRLSTVDELTGLNNRRGFDRAGRQLLELCRRHANELLLVSFDLNGFKRINDEFGHAEGDRALQLFAALLAQNYRASDLLGRLGGDEFAVLALQAGKEEVHRVLERLRAAACQLHSRGVTPYLIRFSAGCVSFDKHLHSNLASLLSQADAAVYGEKARSAS
jgi:diguanylate cyclase (GGDEF)-like protein